MTAPPDVAAPPRRDAGTAVAAAHPRRRVGPTVLYVMLFIGYFAFGATMILRYNFFDPDGPSRVANAGYALMSRDPHLSAIGFVWNPLPSLIEMPLLKLSGWWPSLRTDGLAAVVQSAAFMAGATMFVRRIALDRGVPSTWRWIALGCFALNPVIVIYGGAGMSEAAEIFCLLWATRYLMLWVRSRRVDHLAWAGIAIGVGYLTRYEIAFSAVGVGALVLVVSLTHAQAGGRRAAVSRAALNVLIVGFPIMTSFTIWAITGWITTGDLFATLSSNYGNAGQIATAAGRGVTAERSGNDEPLVIASRLLAMQPFVGIAVVLAASVAALRRRFDSVVPLATFGSVLLFSVWGQFTGTTFGWFRFYILAIPLVVVTALVCWEHPPLQAKRWATCTGAVLLSLSVIVGIPVTTVSMLNPDIGNQHLQFGWRSMLYPDRYPIDEQWYRKLRQDDRLIAKYIDDKHLPDGSVLMDTFAGWGIWLASDHVKQFVVTSDYDFKKILNRPWDNGIRYILVSNPALNDAPDAINRRYPTLWADGAGFCRRVYSALGATGQERWRIYQVVGPPRPAVTG